MMCFHCVVIPPWSHFPKHKSRYTFEVVMVKRFIALAAASTALAVAASFYARVPIVQTGAEVGPNSGFVITPSDVLTSSMSDADGACHRERANKREFGPLRRKPNSGQKSSECPR